MSGQYDAASDYVNLKKHLAHIEGANKKRIRLAYLSTPPSVFAAVISQLGHTNFNTPLSKLRLIIEKPFGHNLKTARHLETILKKHFTHDQIFLLDHYLGKEAVFNLLSLRYANTILTSLIRGQYVDNIQINGLESLGTEGRAVTSTTSDRFETWCSRTSFRFCFSARAFRKITSDSIHRARENSLNPQDTDINNSVIHGQYQEYLKEQGVTPSLRPRRLRRSVCLLMIKTGAMFRSICEPEKTYTATHKRGDRVQATRCTAQQRKTPAK